MTPKVLLTAATPWEAAPLSARLGLRANGIPGCYRGRRAILIETGMGGQRTATTLEDWKETVPGVVICTGFAGALQPGIGSGDLVIDPLDAPEKWLQLLRGAARREEIPLHTGRIIAADTVLAAAAEKRALGARTHGTAVDMESAAVRSWAQTRGAVFLSLRVILDELEDRLPDGLPDNDSPAALLRYAAERWRDIPLLLRLAGRQRRGIARLSRILSRLLDQIDGEPT